MKEPAATDSTVPAAFGHGPGLPWQSCQPLRGAHPRLVQVTLDYQDDFETPGISPRSANPRKHRRQIPNLRR